MALSALMTQVNVATTLASLTRAAGENVGSLTILLLQHLMH